MLSKSFNDINALEDYNVTLIDDESTAGAVASVEALKLYNMQFILYLLPR